MSNNRPKILIYALFFTFGVITIRLFYWQIIKSPELKEKALNQTYKLEKILPKRGSIFSSDKFPLVLNQTYYQISIYKPNLKDDLPSVFNKIEEEVTGFKETNSTLINNFIGNTNQKWITFSTLISEKQKEQLEINGLEFQSFDKRFYPENNLAKQIIGDPKLGGLETYYDKQLKGKTGFSWASKDAIGNTILNRQNFVLEAVDGRDIYTTINRSLQFLLEQKLNQGIEKYSADAGSAMIMETKTGAILAMASLTATGSATPSAFRNSAISDLFEPGSIFKPIVVTMALDKKIIDKNYICTGCGSARPIGKYTITNWDSATHPDSSLQDIIKNSDNIGMSYIITKLGLNNFLDYYHKMGLAQKTGIDLQGETKPILKTEWPEIDLATASFGQGIAVTQINMTQAFNIIANDGVLVRPHVLNYFEENGKIIYSKSKPETSIFSRQSIDDIKSILKYSVENGAVARFKPNDLEVCGKSGTAQVAVKGGYTDSSTIASYIGFSPCNNPKFTMIVTINNPRTSPWGSSTAAPIWFDLAEQIGHLL
jgi:cell division protein FtsI/penicillin-binding protein 2